MDVHKTEAFRRELLRSVEIAFDSFARAQHELRDDLCRSIETCFQSQPNVLAQCVDEARSAGFPELRYSFSDLSKADTSAGVLQPPYSGEGEVMLETESCMCMDNAGAQSSSKPCSELGLYEPFSKDAPVVLGSVNLDVLLENELTIPQERDPLTWIGEETSVVDADATPRTSQGPKSSGGSCDQTGEEPRRRACSRVGIEVARRQKPDDSKPWYQMTVAEFLESSRFDNACGLLIILNAVTIGVQADYAARNRTDKFPDVFAVFDRIFAVAFLSELLLRLYALRCAFFWRPPMSNLAWNYFDFIVVAAQIFEESIVYAASSSGVDMKSFRLLRVLRVLRLVRILRVIRVLRLISELRTIVSSILGSFKSLAWTMVLLLLMIYIVGVYFTQSVTNHLVEQEGQILSNDAERLEYYFGTLARTLLSLWQAISGGEDWDRMAGPLVSEISPDVGMIFIAYIAFAMLALMNVVTGFFVHTALLRAKKEEEVFVADQIVTLFNMTGEQENTLLTEDEIHAVLADPVYSKEWKAIDILAEEAKYIFRLLDINGSASIEFEEFLNGCLRVHGPARSMDLLTVLQEARVSQKRIAEQFQELKGMHEVLLSKVTVLCNRGNDTTPNNGKVRAVTCFKGESAF
eukprot:TRINITY_DN5279_c0_g2_i1.p1 TRINITY_DN5279_c0_g2~~TRINITY_DN5279_c0_g2_i1.p1  ORF type:complete len:634 (+),score=104.71 TRINITY_DN5279_c0_g2_i1:84-1985(+)